VRVGGVVFCAECGDPAPEGSVCAPRASQSPRAPRFGHGEICCHGGQSRAPEARDRWSHWLPCLLDPAQHVRHTLKAAPRADAAARRAAPREGSARAGSRSAATATFRSRGRPTSTSLTSMATSAADRRVCGEARRRRWTPTPPRSRQPAPRPGCSPRPTRSSRRRRRRRSPPLRPRAAESPPATRLPRKHKCPSRCSVPRYFRPRRAAVRGGQPRPLARRRVRAEVPALRSKTRAL
jgi:hypothetical protein